MAFAWVWTRRRSSRWPDSAILGLYDFTRTFGRRRRLALRIDRASINLQRPTAVLFGHPIGEHPQAWRKLARGRVENVDRQRSWRERGQDLDKGAALQFRGHAVARNLDQPEPVACGGYIGLRAGHCYRGKQ